MDKDQLLACVSGLVWPDHGDLTCGETGHPAGHVCLPLSDGVRVDEVVEELGNRYGAPLLDGSGLPSPLVEQARSVYAWPFGGRWIAVGEADARPFLTVAERTTPRLDELAPVESWVDVLLALTGWAAVSGPAVDWAAAESRLGTRLPSDYKRVVETFGDGRFDGFLDVFSPADVIWHAEYWARQDRQPWEPHPPFPAPGGLLTWAGNEHEQSFYWITEGPDPDRWPVYATEVGPEEGTRFECSATEFLCRQLADPSHPFSIAADFSTHWFQSYNRPGEPG